MFSFVLRKTFYDLWDNFLRLVLVNLGFLFFCVVLTVLTVGAPGTVLTLTGLGVGTLLLMVYAATAARSLSRVSDYGGFGFRDFWRNLVAALPTGAVCFAFAALAAIVVTVVIPFYLRMGGGGMAFLAAVLLWALIFALLVGFFFFSGANRLAGTLRKRLKRTVAFVLDNIGFCVGVTVAALILLALSVFLGFMWPGPAGVLLFVDEAVRLRLLKYDWLLEHPAMAKGKGRKRAAAIPWGELLSEDMASTGKRTWRNFIFPWKD